MPKAILGVKTGVFLDRLLLHKPDAAFGFAALIYGAEIQGGWPAFRF